MPIKFGGDMDDPYNPASPFISREDVEGIAADELGLSKAELAQVQAADAERREAREAKLVDRFVGTNDHGLLSDMSETQALRLLCQAMLVQMGIVRDKLIDFDAGGLDECIEILSAFFPDEDEHADGVA
jgi:hypothetical protein